MNNRFKKRLASTVCAFAMLFSSFGNTASLIYAGADDNTELSGSSVPELCHQSFELYPNGEDAEQVITLDGMMPEGASAEAVDVSDEHEGIAAYDISVSDGDEEYQPGEENPILVEITDPDIPADGEIQLWHIRDDGVREQITDFTFEDGKLSFYAKAFSVYEIVELPAQESKDIFESIAERGEEGLDVCYYKSNSSGVLDKSQGPYYFTGEVLHNIKNNGRDGLERTDNASKAVKLYFEQGSASNKFYIYMLDGTTKKYFKMYKSSTASRGGLTLDTVEANKTLFTLTKNASTNHISFSAVADGTTYYVIENNNPVAVVGFNSSSDAGRLWLSIELPEETLNLDGKTYGLMNFTGGTHGYALMADSADNNVHSLVELITHQTQNGEGKTLYVDEGSEVTRWTFHSTGSNTYKLSGTVGGTEKYLAVSGDSLTVVTSADQAAAFTVTPDDNDRIRLSYGGKYVTFLYDDSGEEVSTTFVLSSEATNNSWLNLLGFAALEDSDYITYSADRISISEAVDGQKVIVYTRIWNESTKRYDIYAVDYNGTLYPCYASGGKILWLGDGTGSLEWEFTEYVDPVTKEPNYYYELYNPYSEKYIAPQLNGGQVLSGGTIGINIPGRRNDEFYSQILAWDNMHYAFVGMKPSDDKKKLVPCSESVSIPFYFATLEELNLSDKLHPVPTIDNNAYGITMKMIDFTGDNAHGDRGGIEQNRYLIDDNFSTSGANLYKGYVVTPGLLSSSLGENNYPIANNTSKDLSGLYFGASTVNHLFLESVYNSSGYFEFDSTQNFATLMETNDNNFTVFRELGTSNNESKNTLKHGQFFPYNNISAGVYSKENPNNLYPSDASAQLNETDPRKYEKLYSAGNKKATETNPLDYFFGMEMSAQFVQTVSGLDAWGHDIIFEFKGDDDFWLYVDGELVIDLGGIHSALDGKVNFRTGEVEVNGKTTTLKEIFRTNLTNRGETDVEAKLDEIFEDNGEGQYIFKDYTTHTMRVFYMERGAGASNLYMRFNLASVVPGHVVVKKGVTGDGAEQIDKDMVEYPFQIFYTDGNGIEQQLKNDSEHISVRYQNSTQPVKFVSKYYPPGKTQSYDNIYYLNPSRDAEILFPDEAISYRIVECAVDPVVYGVSINGETKTSLEEGQEYSTDPHDQVYEISGLLNVSSDNVQVSELPVISFDNVVKEGVIRTLELTKRIYDDNGEEILDDTAKFKFRLYLGTTYGSDYELPLADRAPYYVVDPDGYYCSYDSSSGNFVPTEWIYNSDITGKPRTNLKNLTEEQCDSITFRTSIYGAIDKIPSRYTVCVPNLPAGTVFRVEERYSEIPSGYGLDKYVHIEGKTVSETGEETAVNSYELLDADIVNVGKIIPSQDPKIEVHNKKGYGLTVKKKWSDLDITSGHAPVYTAVYVDGKLLEGSVKQIASPAVSAYYFWSSLEPKPDGSPRTDFDGYEVREVLISGTPTVSSDGTVTDYGELTPLESGEKQTLTATRTKDATPSGESRDKDYEYVVSYEQGQQEGSSRTDTVSNTREDGIAIRLFKWNSSEPLKDGKFTLADSTGKTLGKYTSDSEGTVTILYSFEYGKMYSLTETASPNGYVGLDETVKFTVNTDGTVSLYKDDGVTPWSRSKWAEPNDGENGITAFVDVYNKPFNFKIVKTDSVDTGLKLGSAHFALYKQSNTTISGYVKNKDPMTGFEDLVTKDGEVDVCGGNSGRYISPGVNGSVYFLTETRAPFNYNKLDEDIVFRISPLGEPTMISDAYQGTLIETEDSYIYTLSVPNTKKDTELSILTINKKVEGSFGNRSKEFEFTVAIEGAEAEDGIVWAKNGEEQIPMSVSGGSFTMKHNDRIEISLPKNVNVTLTEDSEEYSVKFKRGDGPVQNVDTLSFTFSESEEILVTNTFNGTVATGISSSFAKALALTFLPLIPITCVIFFRKRRKT